MLPSEELSSALFLFDIVGVEGSGGVVVDIGTDEDDVDVVIIGEVSRFLSGENADLPSPPIGNIPCAS